MKKVSENFTLQIDDVKGVCLVGEAWAGCVAGAVVADEYIGMMKSVGLTDISIVPVYFNQETAESEISDMKDVIELKTVSRERYPRRCTAQRSQPSDLLSKSE